MDDRIDFAAAEMFLKEARAAHDSGDRVKCLAARKMVAIALDLSDSPSEARCRDRR